jgi:G3E family GTPase
MPVPVHVIGGFLGSGKTTLLQKELARRQERCAVVVNDFGEAKIDRQLLGAAVGIQDIPGGCLCCTAPEGLVPALTAILAELRPDRIFIEPSGLARPQDIGDMLRRSALKAQLDLGPVVVLVDPERLQAAPNPLLQEQLEAADILVASRCDLASPEALAGFESVVAKLWPPPLKLLWSAHGQVGPEAWEWPAGAGLRLQSARQDRYPSTWGFEGRSFFFPPEDCFSYDALRRLIEGSSGLERFKGLFRSDLGYIRVDLAGGKLNMQPTAYRRDSRADAIFLEGADIEAFSSALSACLQATPTETGPAVALVDADGNSLSFSREALAALPEQIADVAPLVPGREGAGLRLRGLLSLAGEGAQVVFAAQDGMTTEPVGLAEAGDAILLHSLGDGPLPAKQGGPFRLLAAGSPCGNVKGVVRIRILPG